MVSGEIAADTRSARMIEKKHCTDKRVRPSLFCVMFDIQWNTHKKCWLTKIYYYVKTSRVEKRKIYTWEEYFCVKQIEELPEQATEVLLTQLFRKR